MIKLGKDSEADLEGISILSFRPFVLHCGERTPSNIAFTLFINGNEALTRKIVITPSSHPGGAPVKAVVPLSTV